MDQEAPDTPESLSGDPQGDDPVFRARAGWGLLVFGMLAGVGAALTLGWLLTA